MVGTRQFDEQEVIAIALEVFWRKGLHDATMQDLATARASSAAAFTTPMATRKRFSCALSTSTPSNF